MKFRTGLIVGGALGYYYGAKAGRERYRQIDDALEKVRTRPAYKRARRKVLGGVGTARDAATAKVGQLVDDAVSSVRPSDPEPSYEPGLEFNPDFTPTSEEIMADMRGESPSA